MARPVVQISTQALGTGKERICYRHPQEPERVIKLQRGDINKQSRREIDFYRRMRQRGMTNFYHIPRYYGKIDTNLGRGMVFDLVSDFDGRISQSLWDYFQQGIPLAEFYPYLEELKQYMLDNLVVFSADMGRFNVLFQRLSESSARLVVIDGLGNHTAMNWLDIVPGLARRKINRRWQRFITRLQRYSDEVMQKRESEPQQLEPAYRRA